jgi:hypothetical protein
MSPPDAVARDAILARLSASRAEIRRLLEPPTGESGEASEAGPSRAAGGFPRSRTMRLLMSGRGLGAVGATAAGLLIARPALAWRLIRLLPTGALSRMLIGRVLGALRAKQ